MASIFIAPPISKEATGQYGTLPMAASRSAHDLLGVLAMPKLPRLLLPKFSDSELQVQPIPRELGLRQSHQAELLDSIKFGRLTACNPIQAYSERSIFSILAL